jgi:ATP-binding cassette subfamily C exporter for protease/lipase
MGMLSTLKSNWQEQHNKVLALQTQIADKTAGLSSLSRFVRVLLQSIALGAGALLVIGGHITPGLMIAASIILGRVLNPVEQVIGSWKQFVQFRSAWHQLNLAEGVSGAERGTDPAASEWQHQRRKRLRCSPRPAFPLLRNISFQLEQGEVWGLSALQPQENLAGKGSGWCLETVIRKVRLDGADICQWIKRCWARLLAICRRMWNCLTVPSHKHCSLRAE